MGVYTTFTRRWLEDRYASAAADGVYLAHQPIYGRGVQGYGESGHVHRLARQFQILAALNGFQFETLLDVGASEGFTCHLARTLFGVEVFGTDLSAEACKRAAELFSVDAVRADGSRLPFPDDAFDAVVCTEVLEHVEFPVETLLELRRVTRRVLIVTTDEVRTDRALVDAHEPPFLPHIERNLFHPDDFRVILSPAVLMRSQFQGEPPEDSITDDEAVAWIKESLASEELHAEVGALVLDVLDESARSTPRVSEAELFAEVLKVQHPLRPPGDGRPDLERVASVCVCPRTRKPLRRDGETLVGGGAYPITDGIPSFCLDASEDPTIEDLERVAADLWPEDEDRQRAVLAIRRRLDAPDPTETLAWRFDDPAARAAWRLVAQLEPCAGDDLTLRVLGDEPWMLGPATHYPPQGLLGFEVEMAVSDVEERPVAPFGQLYWIGPFDSGFEEEHSVGFNVIPDGTRRRYRVDLTTPPNDTGQDLVFLFRFDPLDRPGTLSLHSFRFLQPRTRTSAPGRRPPT